MPVDTASSQFVFRGTAVPIGGRIFTIGGKPINRSLPSPNASALTRVGGYSLSKSSGSSFQKVFTWGPCVAESIGEPRDGETHVTQVTCSIERVSATNKPIVFTADRLKIVIDSIHPRRGQPSITPREITFGTEDGPGMTLNGERITVVHDLKDFQLYPTFTMFDQEYRTNKKFFQKYRDRFLKRTSRACTFGQRLPRGGGGYVYGSIVREIKYAGKTIPGDVLTLEGFGSIYFGELIMDEDSRRLTLVRLMMGSDVRADSAHVEVDINGSWPS
jgi:hypothetical protein